MSIIDNKKKVFGNIAAIKTLTEGLPKLKLSSSFPSINNGGDSITFLTDLIKSLIGYLALVVAIVDILTHTLADIEREIKKALKLELKNIVSCGVDPSLPAFIKSTGPGINIEVSKVDFLDLFKVDPNTTAGQLLYNDVTTPAYNSTDFNTFLYGVIQDDGVTHTWQGIFDITFNSVGPTNNTFTIKANPSYNSKTLTDLNNDFIDGLTLFNAQGMVNRIIDLIFGSISFTLKKTRKQLENEAKINNVIDCMVNADSNDTVDDSYFTFTNDEVYVHQQSADYRKKGIIPLECCNKVPASVPISMLTDFNNQMTAATTTTQQKEVISTNLNKMAEQNTVNAPNPSDHASIKLNFVQQLINNLIRAIIGIVLSPKVVMIFLINYKIIYGPTATYGDAVDFIKKNKNLFHAIMKKIAGMIIKILIVIALKKIAELVAAGAAKKQVEKGKNQLSQLLSLVGVSQETLRIIKGLA
jgi:hypothetical protein